MDPDAPWQGSPEAAPGKAVEAEHEAASRSYVQREGDDARGGRVRDAIIEVARAMERRGQNPTCWTEKTWRLREIAKILITWIRKGPNAPETAKVAGAPAVWRTLTPPLTARVTIAEPQDGGAKQHQAPRSTFRRTACCLQPAGRRR